MMCIGVAVCASVGRHIVGLFLDVFQYVLQYLGIDKWASFPVQLYKQVYPGGVL